MKIARLLVLFCLAAPAAWPAERPTLTVDVHFTSRTTVVSGPEMKAAAKARQAEAERKAKELERSLKAQYGKNDDKWPRDKEAELSALRTEASDSAGDVIEADYAGASPKQLADSARDLAKAVPGYGKGALRVVDSADQAHLVVEVTGRHSSKSDVLETAFDDQFGFILRVSAGGKLAAGQLHRAVVDWPGEDEEGKPAVNELHAYSDDEPYWRLQVQGGNLWTDLAKLTDGVLADFVRANAALFASK